MEHYIRDGRGKAIKVEPYDEDHARRVAWVMGENSAAARSLVELEQRRACGESVRLYTSGSQVIVARLDASEKPL